MSAAPETNPQLAPGSRVGGKYVVRRLIAQGGSSEVYEAEHAAIGRPVAIKVVHASVGTVGGMLERLRREARICGSLRHPHVCEVFDVGHLDEGPPYLVMELLQGPTLADLLDEGPLTLPAAVEVGRAVASALAAAHREGVIHRDVKPHNVILHYESDGSVVVKLVDFGIARPLVLTDADRSVTVEGVLVGTPHYMAPEQLLTEAPDERSDVYALGVMLYEAITGSVPFDEPTLAALSAAVLRDPVIAPGRLRSDCGTDLEALVLAAMARSPDQRIQSAADFAAALERIAEVRAWPTGSDAWRVPRDVPPTLRADVDGVPTTVRAADSLSPQSGKTLPPLGLPSRAWSMPATLVAVALVAFGTWWLARSSQEELVHVSASPRPEIAPAPPMAPHGQDGAAGAVAPAMAGELEGTSATDAASEVAAAPGRASRIRRRARVHRRERSSPDVPSARRAASPEELTAQALSAQALSAYARAQLPRARALYRRAIERDEDHAPAWRGLGLVASRMGRRAEAAHAFRRYLALAPGAGDAPRIRQMLAAL